MYLFPDLSTVGLSCAFNCSLVVLQVNKSCCELGPVGDARVEDRCCFMVTFLISLVTRCLHISDICAAKELFKFWEMIKASKAEGKRCVDGRFSKRFPSHAEILDEILILASLCSNPDDFIK